MRLDLPTSEHVVRRASLLSPRFDPALRLPPSEGGSTVAVTALIAAEPPLSPVHRRKSTMNSLRIQVQGAPEPIGAVKSPVGNDANVVLSPGRMSGTTRERLLRLSISGISGEVTSVYFHFVFFNITSTSFLASASSLFLIVCPFPRHHWSVCAYHPGWRRLRLARHAAHQRRQR